MQQVLQDNKLITGLVFLLLLTGLVLGVYFVQKEQIFKSQAAVDLNQAFEVKDGLGRTLSCSGGENPTCTSQSLDVNIKVRDLNALLE